MRGVLARRPQTRQTEPGPLLLNRLREDLLNLMDNPAAPTTPTLQGSMSELNLYVAVNGHPEHGSVLRFGFDSKSAPAGLFTRDDLQGATSDKVAQIVSRYGQVFVQERLDRIGSGRALRALDGVQAAARQRQMGQQPVRTAPSGHLRQERPAQDGRAPTQVASPTR